MNTSTARVSRGFSLIEMMIALVLGLLVAVGIVNVFMVTSGSSLVQTQLAKLQEEGRFAVTALTADVRMSNAQYCSNMGGQSATLSNGVMSLDRYLRAPRVLVRGDLLQSAIHDDTTLWGKSSGGNAYPDAPTTAFSLPAFLSMRGYDCTKDGCTPVDPADTEATDGIPAQGTAAGDRVLGTDVLTLRYLDGSRGWKLDGAISKLVLNGQNVSSMTVSPQAGEPPLTDYSAGDLLMLSDCNASQVFAASASGGTFTPATTNIGQLAAPSGVSPKLFDFNRDYHTVSYYLQVIDNNDGAKTGALMRRVNGVSGEVVRGVERLDFLYGVIDPTGNTSYRTAAQIDASTTCASSTVIATGTDPGCMWRSVSSIEIHVLMDGQVPLHTLTPTDLQYQYYADTDVSGLAAPDDASRVVTPAQQGFDNHMIRREFTSLVSIRNYNP